MLINYRFKNYIESKLLFLHIFSKITGFLFVSWATIPFLSSHKVNNWAIKLKKNNIEFLSI